MRSSAAPTRVPLLRMERASARLRLGPIPTSAALAPLHALLLERTKLPLSYADASAIDRKLCSPSPCCLQYARTDNPLRSWPATRCFHFSRTSACLPIPTLSAPCSAWRQVFMGCLPEEHKADIRRKLQNAYSMADYADAKRALERLPHELMHLNPTAACSQDWPASTTTANFYYPSHVEIARNIAMLGHTFVIPLFAKLFS